MKCLPSGNKSTSINKDDKPLVSTYVTSTLPTVYTIHYNLIIKLKSNILVIRPLTCSNSFNLFCRKSFIIFFFNHFLEYLTPVEASGSATPVGMSVNLHVYNQPECLVAFEDKYQSTRFDNGHIR